MTKRILLAVIGAALLAHLLLWPGLPLEIQALGALMLMGGIPGFLLVEALVGQGDSRPDWWERILYSIAAAYTVIVGGMLLLTYATGSPTRWPTIAAFDVLSLALLAWVAWRARGGQRGGAPTWSFQFDKRWVIAGALTLAIAGAAFRFGNLGYADYQGDEARATLRSAAVLQGYEDVLFLHKKGPTEILLPTSTYVTTGHLTEATARLPFAIAGLVALFAVWLLGWRLFNPLAGWVAAMFFALDGYFIGFARIVQYQSVVLLMAVLVVLILYRLVRHPQALTGYLTLAALFLATGLLSHYEGALVALPAIYLWLVLLWRNRSDWKRIAGATAVAAVAGGALLGSFYIPYVVNPRFAATYQYLTSRRIGGKPPYNNLSDVFLRTTLYSTTYYVVLLIVLTAAGMVRVFFQNLRRSLAGVLSVLTVIFLAVTFVRPQWLQIGERDWIIVPFTLLFAVIILLPRLSVERRTLWLWFGAVMVLALFLTEKPRTHVYTFFIPWLIIDGEVLAAGWYWLRRRTSQRLAAITGVAVAGVAILVAGNYAYWYFVSPSEVMLNYFNLRPPGYWVAYDEPDDKARYGYPHTNGWKAIGELYNQGIVSGPFDTTEKEAWVPAWYTRTIDRCHREAQWYFDMRNLEPFSHDDELAIEHFLRQGFEKWARVQVGGRDKMTIYKRTGNHLDFPTQAPVDNLPIYRYEDLAAAFDQSAGPNFPLTYPVVDPAIAHPLHVNFGNQIWLEGYDIQYPQPLHRGDQIKLTLYWRGQKPIAANYKVFNQLVGADGKMQAQRDGYPVCDGRETWRWDPGELITDVYTIPVLKDAVDGLYPLNTGFYQEESGDRLPVLDENGKEIGSQYHVTDVRIGQE